MHSFPGLGTATIEARHRWRLQHARAAVVRRRLLPYWRPGGLFTRFSDLDSSRARRPTTDRQGGGAKRTRGRLRLGPQRPRPLRARHRRGGHRQDQARLAHPAPRPTRPSRRSCANASGDPRVCSRPAGRWLPIWRACSPSSGRPRTTPARSRSSRRCGAHSPRRARAARSPSCSTTSTGPTRRHWRSFPSSRAGCETRPSCSSCLRATRCRPTATGSAACAASSGGRAISSSCRCVRSTARTRPSSRRPWRARSSTTTS